MIAKEIHDHVHQEDIILIPTESDRHIDTITSAKTPQVEPLHPKSCLSTREP